MRRLISSLLHPRIPGCPRLALTLKGDAEKEEGLMRAVLDEFDSTAADHLDAR